MRSVFGRPWLVAKEPRRSEMRPWRTEGGPTLWRYSLACLRIHRAGASQQTNRVAKHQAPKPKLQRRSKSQAPNPKNRCRGKRRAGRYLSLQLGASLELGVWFGAFRLDSQLLKNSDPPQCHSESSFLTHRLLPAYCRVVNGSEQPSDAVPVGCFHTTHWSEVLAAG